jgi:Holliday junction resolvase
MTANTNQPRLYHEDFLSALDEDVRAMGGRKAVAMRLRPELGHKPHEAHVWLNNCLNSERRERLSDEQIRQIIRWAKEAGSFAAINYWCDDTGFERARPMSPEKEVDKVLDRASELIREARSMTTVMERLVQSGALRSIPAKGAASG